MGQSRLPFIALFLSLCLERTYLIGPHQVVSVLAFNSDDLSSNPADVYSLSVNYLERTKINRKRGREWAIKKGF